MAPRKLSDSDKSDIVDLYRAPEQTTSTLAEQFGVSNSTISRILKTTLPSDEYSELIAQKRMSSGSAATKTQTPSKRRSSERTGQKTSSKVAATADELPAEPPEDSSPDSSVEPPKLKKTAAKKVKNAATTSRRRSRQPADDAQLGLLDQDADADLDTEAAAQSVPMPASKAAPAAPVLVTKAGSADDEDDDDDSEDDLEGLDDTLGDDFGDDDDDLEDEDDDDLDDDEENGFELPRKLRAEESVEIMPLDTAVMPKPCYLVVDMRAELITRPLSDFAHLGRIPSEEEKSMTLPVFDNHRVARRFSRNKQRVIKVPDGSLITRTSPYLQAKGITRLLVDGQVFDLVSAD